MGKFINLYLKDKDLELVSEGLMDFFRSRGSDQTSVRASSEKGNHKISMSKEDHKTLLKPLTNASTGQKTHIKVHSTKTGKQHNAVAKADHENGKIHLHDEHTGEHLGSINHHDIK